MIKKGYTWTEERTANRLVILDYAVVQCLTKEGLQGVVPDGLRCGEGLLVEGDGVPVHKLDAGTRQHVMELVQEHLPPGSLQRGERTGES